MDRRIYKQGPRSYSPDKEPESDQDWKARALRAEAALEDMRQIAQDRENERVMFRDQAEKAKSALKEALGAIAQECDLCVNNYLECKTWPCEECHFEPWRPEPAPGSVGEEGEK